MASFPSTNGAAGVTSLLRRVLLGAMLIAAVIVGLLAMHTLNFHASSATHGASAGAGVAAEMSQATTAIDSGTQHLEACEGCVAEEHNTAAICILVLIVLLTTLLTPRYLGRWLPAHPRPGPPTLIRHLVRPRRPSLEVLCISRI